MAVTIILDLNFRVIAKSKGKNRCENTLQMAKIILEVATPILGSQVCAYLPFWALTGEEETLKLRWGKQQYE